MRPKYREIIVCCKHYIELRFNLDIQNGIDIDLLIIVQLSAQIAFCMATPIENIIDR